MSLFDVLIVQPIFNVLILIYGLVPGGDFGVAIILLTIIIRLLMWPLIKKQLHQTKVIRKIQPELKKIRVRSKGNKQLQSQLMLELYREKGVNPFSSIGLLLVQLPIFIALYQVIDIVTRRRNDIAQFTYGPFESLDPIRAIIANPQGFNETLFNVVNLAERAITASGNLYIPALVLTVAAAILQYVQARQTLPQPDERKRLRDMLKLRASGQEVDQTEITAAVSNKMVVLLPFMTLIIGLYLPAALVLYFAVSSLVAVIQQHIILREDVEEMEDYAKKDNKKAAKNTGTKPVQEAEIISQPTVQESKTLTKKVGSSKKKRKKR